MAPEGLFLFVLMKMGGHEVHAEPGHPQPRSQDGR